MTDDQRAEFAAWKTLKQQQADAKALAEAEAAAAPKRFDAMSETEKRAWAAATGHLNSGLDEGMSAAVAVPGAKISAGDLDALCKAVRKRAAWDVYYQHDDREHIFRAVGDRLLRTRNGQTVAGAIVRNEADLIRLHEEFEADLRGLLALPVDMFVQCVRSGATTPTGFNAHHAVDALRQIRVQQTSPALPRVQPRELLARLAAAGVLVQAPRRQPPRSTS